MPEINTVPALDVLVGEDKAPIRLTTYATEVLQTEAGAQADVLLDKLEQLCMAAIAVAELTLDDLLELRDDLRSLGELVDVLVECQPLPDDDAAYCETPVKTEYEKHQEAYAS